MVRKKEKDGEDVTKFFAIQDIALWESSFNRVAEYDADEHDGKCSVQMFKSVNPEMMKVLVEGDDEDHYLLRVLVKLGARSVYQEADDSEVEVLYSVEATFSVEYFVIKPPTKEMFTQFIHYNSVHNAWPFWRQHVYDTLRRASLPVLPIPFFPGKKPVKKKKITSSVTLAPKSREEVSGA
ncbi:hypothetical protein M0D44_20070 [Xanthomonas prunicola]|uniref:hypothetical protein n=1 Tax=Xanthomonas prunicola TaxID=2053930 RepID=UPI0021B3F568|nr:hypothetical protein [Xanthomonas prunicola]UXA48542.1 hypothetical protein M0D44_20070 [Xanthomonas prunicola]